MDFRDYCQHCGTILPSDCRSDWRKFCSRACLEADKVRMHSEARREARRGRACKICDGEIPAELMAHAIYCGPVCQTKAQRQRVRDMRERNRRAGLVRRRVNGREVWARRD